MSTRNSELVTTNKPLLTVLTHGMGGSAKDWSLKNNQFTYCDDSLITRLSNVVPGGANIYWYVVEDNVLTIYDIGIQNEEIKNGSRTQYSKDYKIEKITDLSKPIIIIFQTDDKYEYNNKVYEDFNYAVSKAVYDVKHLSNGVLPKINLIGHSRGGLTNLQYALDHPELVDSIFSMGTPYLGSTSAMVDFGVLDATGSNIGGGAGTGEEDIVNSNRYMEYYNRWNNNYTNLYSHINVTAIGGYSSMSFLKHIFMSDYAKNEMNGVTRAGIMVVLELIQDAQIIYNVSKSVLSEDWLSDRLLKASEDLIEIIGSFSYATALADILTNEIKFDDDYPYVCWYNDGFVDLDSQLGTIKLNNNLANSIYKGFDRVIIKFTEDNSDFNKVAQNDLPIAHNLETRDDKIINIIINKITLSGKTASDYETYIVNDTEIGIKTILKNTNEESLILPSSIDGKTVVEIANHAFSNNFNGNTSIKSIVVPNTIRKIGNNVFENCIYLENVSFSSNSQLNFLGNYAFMNCTNLNTVLLPSTVTTIGDFIFLNCENLKQYSYNYNTFYNIGSLNCRSSSYSNTYFLNKGYSMFLSFSLECFSRYDFNVESDKQINILLYDEDMNIIFDQPISKNNHTDESIIKDLSKGMYFIKIYFVDSTSQSNLKVTLESRSSNIEELKVDEPNDVLTHLHDNHNEFIFMKNTSGFYEISLNGEGDSPIVYSSGTITVFDSDDNIVDKLVISNSSYANLSDSVENSNNIIIYVQAYKTYTIHIDMNDQSLNKMEILVTNLN